MDCWWKLEVQTKYYFHTKFSIFENVLITTKWREYWGVPTPPIRWQLGMAPSPFEGGGGFSALVPVNNHGDHFLPIPATTSRELISAGFLLSPRPREANNSPVYISTSGEFPLEQSNKSESVAQ